MSRRRFHPLAALVCWMAVGIVALLFTLVMVAIVISGSLWIMYHLNSNMMSMPMPPEAAAGPP